ncbi:MAG: class I SAM-dependent methyltransferase [Methanosphaera sp.]|uniref:class I SAM-dependent methyltransferase n=1 Tax=Methanosphaera sp. TaxID=2666342 RepID=UPI0025E9DCA0|nr:class I SAM-dependent methyltransferase [Methanosphaera sp.]MCI5867667.1 class I SAM-dependent methyltransferase [Methanosphaera sp.]MDD6534135.1 class I SAM-dependent methyltransferase [Methanosphaera sp.]MDY3956056.1 class I SAM-dependent methyltransferase [Methanosphaera sp.]
MIKISYKRSDYQQDMIDNIKLLDNVVELGCHVGISTQIISRLCQDGSVYAYDNSPESTKAMRKLQIENKNIIFKNADVRNSDIIKKQAQLDDIDVLCVDLGGGYHPDTVFKVFFLWSSILKPRVTLIRNQGLMEFVNASQTKDETDTSGGYLKIASSAIVQKNTSKN